MDSKLQIFVLFGIVVFLVCSEAPFVKMTNAACESFNKSWVAFHYCRLKAYSRNKTSLNINATFLEPTNNVSIRLKILKKANGYKPFLFDFSFDACEFMRRRNKPVAKIVWNLIKDVSTVNHTCPYVGLQTVSDFHHIHIPLPWPSGDYLIFGDWFFYNKLIFETNVSFTFMEDL
ncbi:uncharacterized protein LOC127011010 [Drosophila biarmipes]|uniref:uncharacterized protein LOC127011010 n=1 Tax=Drosophila biarmipes TaxID=125945 RepID=UPI0007E7AD1F|nr:uncharacterized protein LOC127011010 [Drosophila biarmipes]